LCDEDVLWCFFFSSSESEDTEMSLSLLLELVSRFLCELDCFFGVCSVVGFASFACESVGGGGRGIFGDGVEPSLVASYERDLFLGCCDMFLFLFTKNWTTTHATHKTHQKPIGNSFLLMWPRQSSAEMSIVHHKIFEPKLCAHLSYSSYCIFCAQCHVYLHCECPLRHDKQLYFLFHNIVQHLKRGRE
jgi:hypothetical protein